jgi:hypothetical protein
MDGIVVYLVLKMFYPSPPPPTLGRIVYPLGKKPKQFAQQPTHGHFSLKVFKLWMELFGRLYV